MPSPSRASAEKHPMRSEIPEGTQPNDMLKVSGKGMPSLSGRDNRGDLYVKLVVKIPKKLNKQQRELLQAFATNGGHTPSKKKKAGKASGAR